MTTWEKLNVADFKKYRIDVIGQSHARKEQAQKMAFVLGYKWRKIGTYIGHMDATVYALHKDGYMVYSMSVKFSASRQAERILTVEEFLALPENVRCCGVASYYVEGSIRKFKHQTFKCPICSGTRYIADEKFANATWEESIIQGRKTLSEVFGSYEVISVDLREYLSVMGDRVIQKAHTLGFTWDRVRHAAGIEIETGVLRLYISSGMMAMFTNGVEAYNGVLEMKPSDFLELSENNKIVIDTSKSLAPAELCSTEISAPLVGEEVEEDLWIPSKAVVMKNLGYDAEITRYQCRLHDFNNCECGEEFETFEALRSHLVDGGHGFISSAFKADFKVKIL